MIGSAAIVLPVLYFQYGFLNGLITSALVCCAACKTATLVAKHHNQDELDFSMTVQRIAGTRWKILYNSMSMILLFACALINMILACSLIYPILSKFIKDSAIQAEFTFTQFSYQWLGIIYTILMLPTFLIKNIAPLLKFLTYGVVSVVLSLIFLIVKGSMHSKAINWMTYDFSTLPGVFGLAFMGHLLITPILNNNKNVHHQRDIKIAYGCTFLIYQIIGLFGSFALNDQLSYNGVSGATILDYYPEDDYIVISLQLLIFIQLSLAFPVIQYVTRARFFELLHPIEIQKWHYFLFSIVFSVCCLTTELLNADLSFIISITGAIIGLFIVYLIPIKVHLTALYSKQNAIENTEDLLFINSEMKYKPQNKNKTIRYISYGLLLTFGMSIMVSRFI